MARTYEQDKLDVAEAVKTIMGALNGGNRKEIATVIHETVSRDHRTLQQNFWAVMLDVQMQYADNRSDLRNEASVKLANLVKQVAIENNMDLGLPYV